MLFWSETQDINYKQVFCSTRVRVEFEEGERKEEEGERERVRGKGKNWLRELNITAFFVCVRERERESAAPDFADIFIAHFSITCPASGRTAGVRLRSSAIFCSKSEKRAFSIFRPFESLLLSQRTRSSAGSLICAKLVDRRSPLPSLERIRNTKMFKWRIF